MEPSPSLRVYGGVRGDQRRAERRAQLIEAGLDLLGSADGAKLTVRGACQRAGVVARYFYESFADRDDLASAVYDHVVAELADSTLAAVAAAEDLPIARARAGLDNIVRLIESDPRKGRVLLSAELTDTLIARRRRDSARLFSRLLGEQARHAYGKPGTAAAALTSTFMVGGFGAALTAWLEDELPMNREALVEQCARLLLGITETPLVPGETGG
jgi:AcrR family transcriptional regulator